MSKKVVKATKKLVAESREPIAEWQRRAEGDVIRTSREMLELDEMIADYERKLREAREARKWMAIDHHSAVSDLRNATAAVYKERAG